MANQRNGHFKDFRAEQKCKVRTNPQKERKATRRKSIVDLKRNRRKESLKVSDKQIETLL